MPKPRCKRSPTANRHRALELLAGAPEGVAEALMIAHGFTVELMVGLIRAGLATAATERIMAGANRYEIARLRITEEGRRALAERAHTLLPDDLNRNQPGARTDVSGTWRGV